jgi:predicted  nucleic acid-binding Zn-ribbon protein
MASSPAPVNGSQQSIDVLQKRYTALNTRKIQAETEHNGAEKRLKQLQDEARQKYGTDDVAELQKKLEQMQADNEDKRAKYQADLDRIEGELAAVEQKFAAAQNPHPEAKS